MRVQFDKQLETLNIELIKMGALCEDAISCAATYMLEGGKNLLEKVFQTDSAIDRKEREIETICMRLLLQQQPVAKDLRTVSSALKMISDMERIGDQAADIAEIMKYTEEFNVPSKLHIGDMARATIQMVTDSIESFVKKDYNTAIAVIKYDDKVDHLFAKVKKELTEYIAKDPENGELYLDLLMIAKYFERIGDHATNIAGWVCYSITGKHNAINN